MGKKTVIYLDESGHSGDNYLDAQPFFVLAGFIVPLPHRHRLVALVNRVAERFSQSQGNSPSEVKGGNLLSTTMGRSALADFVDSIPSTAAVPVFQIWEKRYCIAAKIVETLLDPMQNPEAGWLPSGANASRQALSELLLTKLPATHLDRFVGAFRNPTIDAYRDFIERLALALDLLGEDRLARTFRCQLSRLPELVDDETRDLLGLKQNVTRALNYPAFAQMLVQVDTLLEGAKATGDLVNDATRQFEFAFKHAFEVMRGVKPVVHHGMLEDGSSFRIGIGFIKTMRFDQSDQEPGLRAADYLAAAVRGATLRTQGLAYTDCPNVGRIARLLLPALTFTEWAKAVGSERFVGGLMGPVVDLAKELASAKSE
jgi:hypothetical protein